jgi:glucokinase
MTEPLVIGIDVGGTKLAGVAVRGAEVVATAVRPLDSAALDVQVVALARELEGGAGRAAAIGVAAPGQVDVRTGVIEMAVNLAAVRLPIGPLVGGELGVPCFVEHDARAVAAWLAHQPGAPLDLAYLSVGTGISAGVVIGGRLLRGADGLAGEVGHLLADPAGPPCACGLVGCLEAIASGPAVARAAALELAAGVESSLGAQPEPADVYRAAEADDPLARRLVERAAFHLAAAVRGLALAYGVSRVVVGGGVTRAGTAFSAPLITALDRERAGSKLARRAMSPGQLEVLDGGRPLGALGASAVARQGIATPAPAPDPEGEVALR